jgi:hypothetical protein
MGTAFGCPLVNPAAVSGRRRGGAADERSSGRRVYCLVPRSISRRGQRPTDATAAIPPVLVCVLGGELMTRVAVSLGQVPCRRGVPSKRVFSGRDWTHVIRSDAGPVVTHEVIENEAWRDGTVHSLPVDFHGLGGLVTVSGLVAGETNASEAVTVPVEVLLPDPATRNGIFNEVGLAGVMPVNETTRAPLDSTEVDVVVIPDAWVLPASAGAFVTSRHGMKTIPEALDAA